jgi:thiamine pyrophosphate-dependent acetolactate synthase large subunit-like protein
MTGRTRVSRHACLAALAPLITDELVVSNVARTSFEWHDLAPREGNLYTMGMGLVSAVGLGLALALPHRRIVTLDGDGGMLLNLGVLTTIANQPCPNLTVIVCDNESYASTGGLSTASAGRTDLAGIARAAGIAAATTTWTVDEFRAAAEQALRGPGPSVIVAKVDKTSPLVGPKLMDGRENKFRFVRYIESTEGLTILRPSVVGRKD